MIWVGGQESNPRTRRGAVSGGEAQALPDALCDERISRTDRKESGGAATGLQEKWESRRSPRQPCTLLAINSGWAAPSANQRNKTLK
eukprot:2700133-Lingulodinium_polyedra.AAC.1